MMSKWRLRHGAVADSTEEVGDRLFTLTRLPLSQWKSAETTNTIERLHEEFRRGIKAQTLGRPSGPSSTFSGLSRNFADQGRGGDMEHGCRYGAAPSTTHNSTRAASAFHWLAQALRRPRGRRREKNLNSA
jgi:hypothetical protein